MKVCKTTMTMVALSYFSRHWPWRREVRTDYGETCDNHHLFKIDGLPNFLKV